MRRAAPTARSRRTIAAHLVRRAILRQHSPCTNTDAAQLLRHRAVVRVTQDLRDLRDAREPIAAQPTSLLRREPAAFSDDPSGRSAHDGFPSRPSTTDFGRIREPRAPRTITLPGCTTVYGTVSRRPLTR